MKKRIVSLLLALVLLVGLLPTVALAASGDVDVYIIGKDDLITYQKVSLDTAAQIDVSAYGVTSAKGATALHAIVAALRAVDLEDELHLSGGYITQIGDLVAGRPNYMSGWMYKLNNEFPDVGVAERVLSSGDELILFWEQGLEKQQYCQFTERKATVAVGEALTLTAEVALLDVDNGLGKNIVFDSLKAGSYSMLLYVDGKLYPDRIMSTSSTASLYFSAPGPHIVTAKVVPNSKKNIVEDVLTLPVCVVTVTGNALPSAGSLKKLTLTNNQTKQPVAKLEILDGITDYHVNVDFNCESLTFDAEYDESAQANNAQTTYLYVSTTLQIPMMGTRPSKDGHATGSYTKALSLGENDLALFIWGDKTSCAYRPIYLHVNRSSDSPNAQLSNLDVQLGENDLCKSAADDQIKTPDNGVHLKLFYQKADGSMAACNGTTPDASARSYTAYLPYETEQIQIQPTVADKGTFTLSDAEGNPCTSTVINFTGDSAIYTIKTTSSDGTSQEVYTLTLLRRPNYALTSASIDCGRLWLPGVVPGYNEVKLYVTDKTAESYTAVFAATPGSKLYLGSITEENLLADGRITRQTPKMKNSSLDHFDLIVAGEMEDGSTYSRTITVSVEEMRAESELVELVVSPSQHMVTTPYDTSTGSAMLSAFGGYMTTYFKDPIKNDPNNPYGLDFYVNGNPYSPNVWSFSEPAQIYVAQDKDGDGEPDKWYALAGSEHYEDNTYWDYEITYTNEGSKKVRWDDNLGNTGYVCGLSTGSDFPSSKVQTLNSRYRTHYASDVLKLSGILLGPVKSENMTYAPITIFGYGDCYPVSQTVGLGAANPYRDPGLSEIDNSLTGEAWEKAMTDQYGKSSHGDAMDISWAVDAAGMPVYLDEISFVRVMSSINVDAGVFSEKSPEISDITRLPVAERREQDVGISDLPDTVVINGESIDLKDIRPVNGQASKTVYLAKGSESAAITVEAGDRNVILGNRYRKSYTYDTIAEEGRLVRIITQDGEKAPSILVLNIQRYGGVREVVDLINAIGTVTKDSGAAITAARSAYDALTDEQKALVSNYQELLDAEKRYAEITAPVTPVTPSRPAQKPFNEAAGQTLPFADVSENSWYYSGVKYAYENGLMNGTGANRFSPNADTTRGMIVTMLARMEGQNTSGTPWYAAGQKWAMDNGISDGTNMEGRITREQLAAILFRYAKMKGYDVSKTAALTAFSDAEQVSSYAVEAMQWATAEGLIQGSNGKLDPKGTATRAQVATILMRFAQSIAK